VCICQFFTKKASIPMSHITNPRSTRRYIGAGWEWEGLAEASIAHHTGRELWKPSPP
jgi:hypothetical protein